jgi:acyl carrier protein
MTIVDDVVRVLNDVLRLGASAEKMTVATPLLGAIPEMDSMAVVSIVAAIEDHFGISFSDDEITGESFETVGSLVTLVSSKLTS